MQERRACSTLSNAMCVRPEVATGILTWLSAIGHTRSGSNIHYAHHPVRVTPRLDETIA